MIISLEVKFDVCIDTECDDSARDRLLKQINTLKVNTGNTELWETESSGPPGFVVFVSQQQVLDEASELKPEDHLNSFIITD